MTRPTPPPRRTRRWLLALGCAAAVSTAGCGMGGAGDSPAVEHTGGAIGPDTKVSSDIKLLSVQLAYPPDRLYSVGDDASLRLSISNSGAHADRLIGVSGPDFDHATGSGGDHASVDIPVPHDAVVEIGAQDDPTITLVGLNRSLRSSQSIAVTFTFQRAGKATVQAMVSADRPSTPSAMTNDPSTADG